MTKHFVMLPFLIFLYEYGVLEYAKKIALKSVLRGLVSQFMPRIARKYGESWINITGSFMFPSGRS